MPAPDKFGWSLRSSAGSTPDPKHTEAVARKLKREVFAIDGDGYECELNSGVIGANGDVGYVESRAKDIGFSEHGAYQRHIDISIRVHLLTSTGQHQFAEIESYNPFFGCDVRFFEWVDHSFILIYRENHDTYACRFGSVWPPRFVEIEDRWLINDNVLAFIRYKQKSVQRLSFPGLDLLTALPADKAKGLGQLPPE